ncbi:MAG TPA: acyl-ACP--UDP-N-acetylglucosamine O-acyltransferase [candidate division Zixibacteria bacterium]|nr:acyl-ACP--UDP-N-acetylglucosamine O-acyltransferase [candidate division Zixibacteria bacterium]
MKEVAGAGVHPNAVVSAKAEIAADVTIGAGTIVEADVTIGAGTRIGGCAYIANGARIGKNVRIHHGAIVGSDPQDLKYAGEKTHLYVGDNTVVREYVTLNRGTVDRGETRIGSNCLLMAYAHVAHDCIVGDNVIMANVVNLAGHVTVEDFAIIGGVVPIHQFTHVGKHTMVGGGFRVTQDIVPYALAAGWPLKITGLNTIGLRRRGFPAEVIKTLERAFKILFYSDLNTSQAVTRIIGEIERTPEIDELLTFIEHSTRGLVKA